MGWVDKQIRTRIEKDDEAFESAMMSAADIVMGEKISQALLDDRTKTKNAIEEMLKYYHVKPHELPESISDINDQLEYLMRPSGIMRRTVNLEEGWYKDAIGAMIGIRKDTKTPVALIPGKLYGYTFFDEKTGKRISVTKTTAPIFETEAICFYKPLPLKKIGIKELLGYMFQTLSTSDFVLIGIATLIVTLVGMLTPRINNIIYGRVVTSQSLQLLFAVMGFLIAVTISQLLFNAVKSLLLARFSTRMSLQVRAASMMRVLSLPAGFFKDYSSGDLSLRLGYIDAICMSLVNTVLTTGLTSLFSLTYIGQMVKYAPGVVIPGVIVIILTVLFSVITTFVQMSVSKRSMQLSAKEAGIDYALISGVQKIKLAGAEKRAFAKWLNTYKDAAKLTYDPPFVLKFSSVVSTCVSLIGTMVIYFFTIRTGVSLADYYSFNTAYGMVMGAFVAVVGMASSFAEIRPMMEMVQPILETVPEVSEDKAIVTKLSGAIELNNVSFRYSEHMPLILDNLSLKIRSGQYVAIVGQTGCGKSTLMRLLLGFETPQKGAVYYDGKDIESLDLKSLRRNIGSVMQNGKLFSGDIFSNITVSAPWLTMDEAWEAAELAGIAEDIREMPMGMHTIISEGSGGISGGQRQRLMIARAIAGKPKILMFDEATSALDNITQKKVSESLDNLKCTRIVIAHRLSTIRQCDRIIVLDKGKIIEDGTYEELLQKNGFFAELVARQRLDEVQ